MALRFAMSGGNFIFSQGANAPGIWASTSSFTVNNNAPAGRGDTYAFGTGAGGTLTTPNLGGPYAGLIAGVAIYSPDLFGSTLIVFKDAGGNAQCDLRCNGSGLLFFTRNGTQIGGFSAAAVPTNSWFQLQFRAVFSTTGTGICEVLLNNVVVLTATGLTNATTVNQGAVVEFEIGNGQSYLKDFYVVDTVSGQNTSYLGDVEVVELFPDGPGVNQNWQANVGPFLLTSVNGAGVYQGTITGGAGNAYQGYNFNITGFVNANNNLVGGICTASSATSLTFGGAATTTETHAATGAFQCIVQPGINETGTRPNQDVTYVSVGASGGISDFAHVPLNPLATGFFIAGVVHQSYMRKDDAGTRIVKQVCLSGSATEQGPAESIGNSYQYYQDILEVDPNTGAQFTQTGLNNATFGVDEIS